MATATTKSKFRARINVNGPDGYMVKTNTGAFDIEFSREKAYVWPTKIQALRAARNYLDSIGSPDWEIDAEEFAAPVQRPAYVVAIETERDNARAELEQYKLMVADLRRHLLSTKFQGAEPDGSRKDWIATGDVLRYIDGF